jgi:hypothetical protein
MHLRVLQTQYHLDSVAEAYTYHTNESIEPGNVWDEGGFGIPGETIFSLDREIVF